MGQEDEAAPRREAFAGFTVDEAADGAAPHPRPSSCTACPPTGARRSPRGARRPQSGSGSRPRTGCTPSGACWLVARRLSLGRPAVTMSRSAGGQEPAPAPDRRLLEQRGDEPGPAGRAAGRGRRRGHPGHGVARPRGAGRGEGPDAGGETVYAIPELPKTRSPRGPPAPGARGVGGGARRTRPTWSSCARRRARPTWSPRPSTGAGFEGVLGTVAGDDTILVVVAEDVGGGDAGRAAGRARRLEVAVGTCTADGPRRRAIAIDRTRRRSSNDEKESTMAEASRAGLQRRVSTRRWRSAG